MNILVTGANGFIGSNLIRKLAAASGTTVFACMRTDDGTLINNVKKIISDFSADDFENTLPNNIDCIIHLAQSKHYRNFPEKTKEIFKVNVASTLSLLQWGLKNSIKKFIYFSSGNVYKPQNKLMSETDELGAFSFYGSTKIMAEELCKSYKDYFEIDILRPFGIYGPKQEGMFIQNLLGRLQNEEAIYLASGIGMKTTPMYIDDCVEVVSKILMRDATKNCFVYNLSGKEVLTIKEVAEHLAAIKNITPKYVIENKEPLYLMGDSSKICSDLNFTPKINFENGIKQLFN